MQFLRTMFWVVLAVLGVLFAIGNWTPITVNLWSGIVLDTHLPVLLFASFLIGLVPMLVLYRATRWHLRRRLDTAIRQLTDGPVVTASPLATATMPPVAPITPPGIG